MGIAQQLIGMGPRPPTGQRGRSSGHRFPKQGVPMSFKNWLPTLHALSAPDNLENEGAHLSKADPQRQQSPAHARTRSRVTCWLSSITHRGRAAAQRKEQRPQTHLSSRDCRLCRIAIASRSTGWRSACDPAHAALATLRLHRRKRTFLPELARPP